ncbi:MAG: RNA polymerase sigma factor [Armatimonadetes bacterium]|nr:RNA polymerase sigma factor [Armatimonadota bacterium]
MADTPEVPARPLGMETCTDQDLMRLFYACRDEAFDVVLRRYDPWLCRYLSRCCEGDAEDLWSTVWAKVVVGKLPGHARYDLCRPFRPWLQAIAVNVARDAAAAARRRLEPDDLPAEGVVAGPVRTPEQEALLAERLALLDCLIKRLPPSHQEALRLQESGQGLEEIARRLGSCVGTVGSWLSRDKSSLLRGLDGGYDEQPDEVQEGDGDGRR